MDGLGKVLNQIEEENYLSRLVHIPSRVNIKLFHPNILFKEKDNPAFLFVGRN